jgi:hypothetical protein
MASASTHHEPYDSGDQHHNEVRNKRIRLAVERVAEELRALMGRKDFRAFLWDLLVDKSGVIAADGTLAHDANVANRNDFYFTAGKRALGATILNEILAHCPEHFKTMAVEAEQRTRELNYG